MNDHCHAPPVCAKQTLVQTQPNPNKAAGSACSIGEVCANTTTGAQPVRPTQRHSKALSEEFVAGKSKPEEVLATSKESFEEEGKKFLEKLVIARELKERQFGENEQIGYITMEQLKANRQVLLS